MPRRELVNLPFNAPTYQSLDSVERVAFGSTMIDGYRSNMGTFKKRFGLLEALDLGTGKPVDGLYWFTEEKWAIAISDGKMYKITNSSYAFSEITGGGFVADTRPSFTTARAATVADTDVYIMAANGGRIYYSNGTTALAVVGPTNTDSLEMIDGYVLANNVDTESVTFSQIDEDGINPLIFPALNVIQAATKADKVLGIKSVRRNLHMIGEASNEVWYDDGISPFSKRQDILYDIGCEAKYSITLCDGTLYFISDRRRVTRLVGGQVDEFPNIKFSTVIEGFSTIDDAIGDFIKIDNKRLYILTFPTENETWAYDLDLDEWMQFSTYDHITPDRDRFLGNCYTYCPGWGVHLFGSYADGKIYRADTSYTDDDGNGIVVTKTTGSVDHGVLLRKKTAYLLLRLKRGEGSPSSAPIMTIRWRDNGSTTWSDAVNVDLGETGDTEFTKKISGGFASYVSREWKFEINADVPVTLTRVQEYIEVEDA